MIENKFVRLLLLICSEVIIITLIVVGYYVDWTGFAAYNTGQEYFREKTLWDWMELLIVPLMLAFGALLFNRFENERAKALELQHAQLERDLSVDSLNETALQSYLDYIATLLIQHKLRETATDSEVRDVARIKTLTLLHRLDKDRKAHLLVFLKEAKLIEKTSAILSISRANLINSDLYGANLEGTNLSEVYFNDARLEKANFNGSICHGASFIRANLRNASFQGAELTEVSFHNADITGADFSDAIVSTEQLAKAKNFENTILLTNQN